MKVAEQDWGLAVHAGTIDNHPIGGGPKPLLVSMAIFRIARDGFEWALRHACLSSYVRGVHPDRATWQRQLKLAPARVQ